MFVLIPACILLSLVSTQASTKSTGSPSSAVMLTQSLELIQKGSKSKALTLLEKAFEKSQDPDQLREIASLILEASSENYKKREAYLRYLIKFNSEHAESYKWQKELGDRAFKEGKLTEAEDWYLRAISGAENKTLIRYKLAFVRWNLKQPMAALQILFDILPTADTALQVQIKKDIAKLWWEVGPLSAIYFEKITALSETELKDILSNLFAGAPKPLVQGSRDEDLLAELIQNSGTAAALREFLNNESEFKKNPCFPFAKLLQPSDPFSSNLLLACLKSKDRPPAERMIVFFGSPFTNPEDEKTAWAHAELLTELHRTNDATVRIFEGAALPSRSKDYFTFTESLLSRLNESEFRTIYGQIEPTKFEIFLEHLQSPATLEKLHAIDPDRWIPFEEKTFKGSEPREYLLKKGVWLARKPETSPADLKPVFEKLIAPPLSAEAAPVAKSYKAISDRSETKLPATFSTAFKNAFDAWLSDIDKSVATLSHAPADWQVIARPLFEDGVHKNIEALLAQLDSVNLDPELSELSETFSQKKEEMKQDLQNKYLKREALRQ